MGPKQKTVISAVVSEKKRKTVEIDIGNPLERVPSIKQKSIKAKDVQKKFKAKKRKQDYTEKTDEKRETKKRFKQDIKQTSTLNGTELKNPLPKKDAMPVVGDSTIPKLSEKGINTNVKKSRSKIKRKKPGKNKNEEGVKQKHVTGLECVVDKTDGATFAGVAHNTISHEEALQRSSIKNNDDNVKASKPKSKRKKQKKNKKGKDLKNETELQQNVNKTDGSSRPGVSAYIADGVKRDIGTISQLSKKNTDSIISAKELKRKSKKSGKNKKVPAQPHDAGLQAEEDNTDRATQPVGGRKQTVAVLRSGISAFAAEKKNQELDVFSASKAPSSSVEQKNVESKDVHKAKKRKSDHSEETDKKTDSKKKSKLDMTPEQKPYLNGPELNDPLYKIGAVFGNSRKDEETVSNLSEMNIENKVKKLKPNTKSRKLGKEKSKQVKDVKQIMNATELPCDVDKTNGGTLSSASAMDDIKTDEKTMSDLIENNIDNTSSVKRSRVKSKTTGKDEKVNEQLQDTGVEDDVDKTDGTTESVEELEETDSVLGPDKPRELSGLQKSLLEISERSTKDFSDQPKRWPKPVALDDGSVLVVIDHPSCLPMKGRAQVSCVAGTVDVMGYMLTADKEPCDIFSPDCYSLVTMETKSGIQDSNLAKQLVQNHVGSQQKQPTKWMSSLMNILDSMEGSYVILRFSKIETTLCEFIQSFQRYSNIFRSVGDKSSINRKLLPLGVILPLESCIPCVEIPKDLHDIMDSWTKELKSEENPVVLVCGGKGSGKSTTNRLILNSSLNVCSDVYFLECDIGQTEFTPSGVVSLVHITQPVFGPPFCHQREPVCAYFYGGVSPHDDPDRYLQCVQKCMDRYRELNSPKPLVVNTMGWIKDLGWQLLLDTIRLVSPSLIVQLMSQDRYQNIDPLNVEALQGASWSDFSLGSEVKRTSGMLSREPKFIHLELPVSTDYDFKQKPTDYRNLSILSHLGNDLEPGLTLTSMIPYTIEWKHVCVHVCNMEVSRSQIMYVLNASLVGLCHIDSLEHAKRLEDDGPMFLPYNAVFHWIGFGIVRGIDLVKKLFYITTSLSYNQLSKVNAIVKGGVVLPEQLLTQQKGARLPYVDEVVSTVGIHCKKPRKRMARVSFPSKK